MDVQKYLVEYMASELADVMETVDVNKEWQRNLKDKMPEVATACIDAICAFLSNDNMQSCENTSEFNPPTYMVEEVKKILAEYISSEPAEISRYLLCYIPESTEPKKIQGGGPDLTDLANTAVQNNPSVIAAKGAVNMGTTAAGGLTSGASDAANVVSGAVPDLAGAIPGLAGAVPGLNISPKKNEIPDGKAKTILTKFKSDIVSKFKCDEPTTQYIKDKIIDTMVRAIRNKLIDDNENKTTDIKQLLSSIAKETTTQSINKQISLIQPTIELYKNIIDKGDATVTAMILPDYLRLLLEMFLYTGYGEMLPDGKIKLSIKRVALMLQLLCGIIMEILLLTI